MLGYGIAGRCAGRWWYWARIALRQFMTIEKFCYLIFWAISPQARTSGAERVARLHPGIARTAIHVRGKPLGLMRCLLALAHYRQSWVAGGTLVLTLYILY